MVLHFENPEAFWGFVPVAILLCGGVLRGRCSRGKFPRRRLVFTGLVLTLALFALARPQMGERVTSRQKVSGTVFVLLDISQSMLATDVSPSRMDFSVEFLKKLLPTLGDLRIALYPFANSGFLLLPLTTDRYAAMDMLSTLNPSATTDQGSDINSALKSLFERMAKTEASVRERGGEWTPPRVLLISDGESHKPVEGATLALYVKHKIPVFTVGVGSEVGATIPMPLTILPGTDRLRTPSGAPILTKLDAKALRTIAETTGADYFPAKLAEIPRLSARLAQSVQIGKLQSTFKLNSELFPYFLGAAFFCFLLDLFLGRWHYVLRSLLVVASLAGLFSTPPALAQTKADPESAAITKYNEGVLQAKQQNLKKAAELFEEAALLTPDPLLKKKSLYNLGNTTLKLGEPEQALQFYQQALDTKHSNAREAEPIHQLTSENMELAAKVIEQMQSSSSSDSDQKQEGQGDAKDPGGPKKFQAQNFTDSQKQKIWDMVANEEKQAQERIREQGGRGTGKTKAEKPW